MKNSWGKSFGKDGYADLEVNWKCKFKAVYHIYSQKEAQYEKENQMIAYQETKKCVNP
jgi:hypothetical protein